MAVVGSGPAGLAAAKQLNRAGHAVVVLERDEGPGGLLRFGVPDFKLEKWYIDRRVAAARGRGRRFEYGVDVGTRRHRGRARRAGTTRSCSRSARACTARSTCPGADLAGVRFAMDYLYARNRWVARGDDPGDDPMLTAAGKHVVVIGGGDTAMDCVANALREEAASVTVLDTYPEPPGPAARDSVPWPRGAAPARHDLRARGGRRAALDPDRDGARRRRRPRDRRPRQLRHAAARPASRCRGRSSSCRPTSCSSRSASRTPSTRARSTQLALDLDRRGNLKAPTYETSHHGVFAAGDARIGQSLVVTAIAEGRRCARVVDRHLAALAYS